MNSEDSDIALMLRVKRKDKEAFRELVQRYQRTVINVAYQAIGDHWEAEDLAQRVFVRIYQAAPQYEPTAKFTTWLFTITYNMIRNEHRRRDRHKTQSMVPLTQPTGIEETHPLVADTHDPARMAVRRELQTAIYAAVRSLPDDQRTVVTLCRFEGLSYEEIAGALNCSIASVRSRLHRARETLQKRLRGWY